MKLWVDDIRNAPDDTWHVARTSLEAIRVIDRFRDKVKEISLDHDISHLVTVGDLARPYPCEETFASVAYFIKLMYDHVEYFDPAVFLHTSNEVAGDDMAQVLYPVSVVKKYMGAANRLEMEV